jgi:membrane-associated phospholipid phosphatase
MKSNPNVSTRYADIITSVYKKNALVLFLRIISYFAVAVCAMLYCLMLVKYAVCKDHIRLIGVTVVTGASFFAVTVARRLINAPRPYELISFPVKAPKSKLGRSFPSRHVFSIFLICAVIFFDCFWAGIALAFLGIALACSRVLMGIHFIRDVVAGGISGAICGAVGMCIFFMIV